MDGGETGTRTGSRGLRAGISVPKSEYRFGKLLCGEVRLTGAGKALRIRRLSACLVREWSSEYYGVSDDLDQMPCAGRGMSYSEGVSIEARYEIKGDAGEDTIVELTLAEKIEIKPGEKKIYPFEINLPVKTDVEADRESWKIRVRAEVGFGRDARAEKEISLINQGVVPG